MPFDCIYLVHVDSLYCQKMQPIFPQYLFKSYHSFNDTNLIDISNNSSIGQPITFYNKGTFINTS